MIPYSAWTVKGGELTFMSLTADEVKRVAMLARIAITDEETVQYLEQLDKILGLVERMQAVDTAGVSPMSHAQDVQLRMRDDVPSEADRHEAFQRGAPAVEAGLYLVPQVIE